jgi:hypothetical protein
MRFLWPGTIASDLGIHRLSYVYITVANKAVRHLSETSQVCRQPLKPSLHSHAPSPGDVTVYSPERSGEIPRSFPVAQSVNTINGRDGTTLGREHVVSERDVGQRPDTRLTLSQPVHPDRSGTVTGRSDHATRPSATAQALVMTLEPRPGPGGQRRRAHRLMGVVGLGADAIAQPRRPCPPSAELRIRPPHLTFICDFGGETTGSISLPIRFSGGCGFVLG